MTINATTDPTATPTVSTSSDTKDVFSTTTATASFENCPSSTTTTTTTFKDKTKCKKSRSMDTHKEVTEQSEKTEKKRHRISPEQLKVLTEVFQHTNTPNQDLRERLGQQLNMTSRNIQIWFQNRRSKQRREQQKKTIIKRREDSFVYPDMHYYDTSTNTDPSHAPYTSSPPSAPSRDTYFTYTYQHQFTREQLSQPQPSTIIFAHSHPDEQQQQQQHNSSQSSVTSSSSESLPTPNYSATASQNATITTSTTLTPLNTDNNDYFNYNQNPCQYNQYSPAYPPIPEITPNMKSIDILAVAADYVRTCDEIAYSASIQGRRDSWRPWE